jgi:hypothetical protein
MFHRRNLCKQTIKQPNWCSTAKFTTRIKVTILQPLEIKSRRYIRNPSCLSAFFGSADFCSYAARQKSLHPLNNALSGTRNGSRVTRESIIFQHAHLRLCFFFCARPLAMNGRERARHINYSRVKVACLSTNLLLLFFHFCSLAAWASKCTCELWGSTIFRESGCKRDTAQFQHQNLTARLCFPNEDLKGALDFMVFEFSKELRKPWGSWEEVKFLRKFWPQLHKFCHKIIMAPISDLPHALNINQRTAHVENVITKSGKISCTILFFKCNNLVDYWLFTMQHDKLQFECASLTSSDHWINSNEPH